MARKSLGATTLSVLSAVSGGFKYGFDIMDETGLPSGTVYPALSRLERMGHLRARWEQHAAAKREKRPPRRYYTITASGKHTLLEEAARLRALADALPKNMRQLEARAK